MSTCSGEGGGGVRALQQEATGYEDVRGCMRRGVVVGWDVSWHKKTSWNCKGLYSVTRWFVSELRDVGQMLRDHKYSTKFS